MFQLLSLGKYLQKNQEYILMFVFHGKKFIHAKSVCIYLVGVAAVPDYPVTPWSDDGWPQWEWKEHSLACSVEGIGKAGGC